MLWPALLCIRPVKVEKFSRYDVIYSQNFAFYKLDVVCLRSGWLIRGWRENETFSGQGSSCAKCFDRDPLTSAWFTWHLCTDAVDIDVTRHSAGSRFDLSRRAGHSKNLKDRASGGIVNAAHVLGRNTSKMLIGIGNRQGKRWSG